MTHLDIANIEMVTGPSVVVNPIPAAHNASLARVWRFAALAFGISWLLWGTAALAAREVISVPVPLGRGWLALAPMRTRRNC